MTVRPLFWSGSRMGATTVSGGVSVTKYVSLFLLSLVWNTFALPLMHGQTTKRLQTSVGKALITYDEFGNPSSPSCLIVLHGSGGTAVPFYREQAVLFGSRQFRVLMPHYFDATRSTTPSPENYKAWARVTEDFVTECHKGSATRKVLLVGYSLGASVALGAGSEGAPVDAIAEWYESLPDEFFYRMTGMPPLLILHGERDPNIPIVNARQLVQLCETKQLTCEYHFYSDQGHGFVGKGLGDAEQRTITFFARPLLERKVGPNAQP